jgi:protein-tyrosine phosphatase
VPQVYQRLQQEGYPVHYCRVPVTDGTAPSPATMDLMAEHMMQHGLAMPVVFNCQMGGGRTTTGMVMACLLHMAGSSQLNRISSKTTLQVRGAWQVPTHL